MPYQRLRPSQVILDPENPRLPDGTTSDREAINRLLDDGAEALINLARDMAQTGQSNPAELPIAVKAGPKYLILEGNRRFAALKLLRDPKLADSEVHRQAFRRAAALGDPPASVMAYVDASREAADHWIVLRHTGDNNGRGVRRWSAQETATHRRRANRTVDAGTLRSITIADELEEAYSADPVIMDLIRQTRKSKLTNIGRFFSGEVMTRLGLHIVVDNESNLRERTLWAYHTAEEFRDFFAWAIKYILDNSVDAYKNSDRRGDALTDVLGLIPGEATRLPRPARLVGSVTTDEDDGDHPHIDDHEENSHAGEDEDYDGDAVGDGGEAPSNGDSPSPKEESANGDSEGGPAKSKKRDARPDKYAFQGFRIPNHPRRVQDILKECRQLEIARFPGIVCIMVRVVVELSVSAAPVLALTGARESHSLTDKINAALRFLDPSFENPRRADKRLEQAHLEASTLGISYLNGFVHNPDLRPDEHLARRFSTAFRPLLELIDEALR